MKANLNQVLPSLNSITVYMPEGNHPREMYEIHADGTLIRYASSWKEALYVVAWEACKRSAVHHAYSYSAYIRAVCALADDVAREVYQARMQAEACH